MDLDLQRIKQFYAETWWLWTLYALGTAVAIWKVSLIFISAIPIIFIISLYFAIVRGPSSSLNPHADHRDDQDYQDSETPAADRPETNNSTNVRSDSSEEDPS